MKPKSEKTDATSAFHPVPLDYWETCDARQGGVIVTIDERGLCIHSPVDMRVGGELNIKIFFSCGYVFDDIGASARIVGKDLCYEGGWEAFEYELEFIRMSEEGRLKLRDHLRIRRSSEKPGFAMA